MFAQATAQNQEGSFIWRALGIIAALGYSLFAFYALAGTFSAPNSAQTWLLALSALQLFPVALFLGTGRVDFPTVMLAQAFAYNTLNKLHSLELQAPDQFFIDGQREEAFCLLLFMFAFYGLRYTVLFRAAGASQYEVLRLSAKALIRIGVLSVVLFLIPPDRVPGGLLTIFEALMSALALLIIASECPERPGLHKLLLGMLFLHGVILFIDTATLAALGALATNFLTIGLLRRRTRYVVAVLPIVALGLLFQGIKNDYRSIVWYQGQESGISSRTEILSNLLTKNLDSVSSDRDLGDRSEDEHAKDDAFWMSARRGADDSLERVLKYTPKRVPFWNGETYEGVLTIFIPRFLWPGKPERTFWNKFGRLYEVLLDEDYMTSVAVGFLAEGYMNYGYDGLYGIALFMGALVALVQFLSVYLTGRTLAFSFLFFASAFNFVVDLGTIVNIVAIHAFVFVLLRRVLRQADGA